MVHSKFDMKKDDAATLSWHYQQFLRLDDEFAEDNRRNKSCRYCKCSRGNCNCNSNLRYYWEAAQLLSLVMPSSAAAERVFSLLNINNQQFNESQTRTVIKFSSHSISPTISVVDESLLCLNLLGKLYSFNSI
jgi:hypothetical protein